MCFQPSGTFPIDLTKTRLQVQGQSQYTEVRYKGMFHALFRIGKEEGTRALYSGYTTPSLIIQDQMHASLEQPQWTDCRDVILRETLNAFMSNFGLN